MSGFAEYMEQVERGAVTEGGAAPIELGLMDERGKIWNLAQCAMNSASMLTSRGGSVRANHYHKTDWHFTFVTKGRVLYFERPVGSKEIEEPRVFTAGDSFYTPPMREHAMLFTEESTIFTVSRNKRTHEQHESDVVRVDFITPGEAAKWM